MKEISIVLLIIAIIITGGVITQKYLEKSSDVLISKFNDLKNNLENDNEEIKNNIEDIKKKWESIEKIWSTIVSHEEIDKIELELIELEDNYKTSKDLDNKSEISINVDKIQFLLRSY